MLFRRVGVFFLLLVMVFADNGQMIHRHACLESGETSYSFSPTKHCCSEPLNNEATCFRGTSCCEDTAKYIKQVFVNLGDDFQKLIPAPTFFLAFSSWLSTITTYSEHFPFSHFNPPLKDSSSLSLLQVYRC
ncbi:MAG: hypothetical protein IPP77_00900 [Bacteroidetes bacterium]|nr:hypothetical protein [Bacteroidota bacterium]